MAGALIGFARLLEWQALRGVALAGILILTSLDGLAQEAQGFDPECGKLGGMNQYGPFDYRTITADQKELVEVPHFRHEYAAFLAGKDYVTASGRVPGPVAGGLDYVLRAFPNHHRALEAMDKLHFRKKSTKLYPIQFRVECYFIRAVAFVPNDGLVRALYGAYFARRKMAEAAREQLKIAHTLEPDSSNVQAQLAWSYMEIGDWADAEKHARLAYRNGYPLPGLRDKLKASGHWTE